MRSTTCIIILTTRDFCFLLSLLGCLLLSYYVVVVDAQFSRNVCPVGGGAVGRDFLVDQSPEQIGISCTDKNNNNQTKEDDLCRVGNNATGGVRVCRTGYHPITGVEVRRPLCIRPEEGTAMDECGCCSDSDCSKRPEFLTINCTDDAVNNNLTDISAAVVCRNLFNPFTGIREPETITIRKRMSLDGDVCGCCDSGGNNNSSSSSCPTTPVERLSVFQRPDATTTSKTCSSASSGSAIECRRQGQPGFFVCRTITDPITGVSQNKSVCVEEGQVWEGDTCGCCGDDDEACDNNDAGETQAELACDQDPSTACTCKLKNDQPGNFVCRALFHPFDGELRLRTFCADTKKSPSWVFDTCGCCGDCPVEPGSGFPDEEKQWVALLEEDPSTLEDPWQENGANGRGSGTRGYSAITVVGIALSLVGSIIVAILF
eukprot:scaffold4099_cov98-Cylindrotheca_fusiformis.AAC.2